MAVESMQAEAIFIERSRVRKVIGVVKNLQYTKPNKQLLNNKCLYNVILLTPC